MRPSDGARGGDQRLADDLSAEDPLPADVGAHAAEEIVFQRFEVEYGKKDVDGVGHALRSAFRRGQATHALSTSALRGCQARDGHGA